MKFGIVGNPVDHSLSPSLFRAAYPDGRDMYVLAPCETWDDAWKCFWIDFDAVNVTAPFKRNAFESAAKSDPASFRAEASNVLVRRGDVSYAANTDYVAVKKLLSQCNVQHGSAEVLVVGCGGAGRAAALAALDLGCRVTVANRSMENVQEFAGRLLEPKLSVVALKDERGLQEACGRAEVVVYALPVALDRMPSLTDKTVLEANYRDPALQDSECRRYVSGKSWLLEQAIAGFRLITGRDPDTAAMKRILF